MRTGLWFSVEDDSVVSISVRGQTDNDTQFVGGARHVPDVGDSSIWDVTPGPRIEQLANGMGHTVRIGIRFTSDDEQTAIVEASLTKADGNPHPESRGDDVLRFPLTGKKGDGMLRGTLIFWPIMGE